ncbi:hypothetical protein FGO68_gene7048 [Halteria grandinella]|uniref:Uncharacterized protein n=1 Tax=Halteria grandinella TaxID=5974 RepID=A0A8J8NL38_HALGN|nr:hypothetical protein FGO68_gene7048 [Halteria grandinella]
MTQPSDYRQSLREHTVQDTYCCSLNIGDSTFSVNPNSIQTTPFNNTQCETPLKLINPFHIMIAIGPELLSIFICLRPNLMIYHAQQEPKISSKRNKSNCAPIIPSNPKAHFQTAPGNSAKYGQEYYRARCASNLITQPLHMSLTQILYRYQLNKRY